jgi:uncharacterized protein YbaP (TraB family)
MSEEMQLRRLIIVTFAMLFCLYLATARAEEHAPAVTRPHSGGVLFKVQNGRHQLYLFGTIHVGSADFYPLTPRVMQALEHAPAVALEIDPANTSAMQSAMQQYGFYPAGQSFQTELSASVQQQLLAALARDHIDPASIATMRPWMIANLLTVQAFEKQGYHTELAVDSHLAKLIRQRHKPVIELESAATQLALFGALDNQQQSLLLEDTIKELNDPESAARTVELAQSWHNADLHRLQDLLDEMGRDHSFAGRFAKEVLLDQRNRLLSARIFDLLQQQNGIFAAIGILHLTGTDSVPALLQQRGLTVERLD